MYPSPWTFERPYTGQSPFGGYRCPICGSDGDCPDATPVDMPLPPFDLGDAAQADGGGAPLRSYAVTQNGYVTTMQLNDLDAARLGAAAVLIP